MRRYVEATHTGKEDFRLMFLIAIRQYIWRSFSNAAFPEGGQSQSLNSTIDLLLDGQLVLGSRMRQHNQETLIFDVTLTFSKYVQNKMDKLNLR